GRPTGGQGAPEVGEGEARVDDVLDEQDVPAGQVDVQVLHDPHDARGAGGVAVGGHGHEVDLEGQGDGPGQVAHEHGRALEHADQEGRPALVVGGDGRPELGHPGLEGDGVDDDLPEVRAVDQ